MPSSKGRKNPVQSRPKPERKDGIPSNAEAKSIPSSSPEIPNHVAQHVIDGVIMQRERTRRLATVALMEAKSSSDITRMLKWVTDGAIEPYTHHLAPVIACQAGCAYCCTLVVSVYAFEVFAIAEVINGAWSSRSIHLLKRELARYESGFLALPPEERLGYGVPCPLLAQDGRCTIYPERPSTCQRFVSTDATWCAEQARTKWSGENSHVFFPLIIASGGVAGVVQEVANRGLDTDHYVFPLALKIALTTEGAADRWLAGEPILAPARYKTLISSAEEPGATEVALQSMLRQVGIAADLPSPETSESNTPQQPPPPETSQGKHWFKRLLGRQ